MQIKQLARKLFVGEPKGPGTVQINLDCGVNDATQDAEKIETLASFLRDLFFEGIRIIKGNAQQINLQYITDEEFQKLDAYIKSIGFVVKRKIYSLDERVRVERTLGSNNPKDLSYWLTTVTTIDRMCYSVYFEPLKLK